MRKYFLILAVVIFAVPRSVLADGLEIVAPTGPIFPANEIWYPGRSFGSNGEKWVELKNNETSTSGVEVRIGDNNFGQNAEGGISQEIYLTVYKLQDGTSSCLYGCGSNTKTIKNLYDEGGVKLPISEFSINPNAKAKLYFSVTMDSLADDSFQGKSAVFSLRFGSFLATPTPTPTPTSTSTSTNASSSQPAVCSDTVPSAPANLSAIPSGIGQVLLGWQPAAGTVDHYSIVYGLQSGQYRYGNLDVGKITHYLVSGLAPGERYYFALAAVHGCSSSSYSNEAVAVSGGGALAGGQEKPAAGFRVLGKKTKEGQLAGGEKQENLGPKKQAALILPFLLSYWPELIVLLGFSFLARFFLRRGH